MYFKWELDLGGFGRARRALPKPPQCRERYPTRWEESVGPPSPEYPSPGLRQGRGGEVCSLSFQIGEGGDIIVSERCAL